MSVRLPPDEAWAAVEAAHTGILTTLRSDGWPISVPVWFVVLERTVCLAAPSRTKKVGRVRRDPRAAFLVESGERWAELLGVHLTGTVEIVDDTGVRARIAEALDAKYAAFRSPAASMPAATRAHYAERTFLRFVPDERILSWDNRRLATR